MLMQVLTAMMMAIRLKHQNEQLDKIELIPVPSRFVPSPMLLPFKLRSVIFPNRFVAAPLIAQGPTWPAWSNIHNTDQTLCEDLRRRGNGRVYMPLRFIDLDWSDEVGDNFCNRTHHTRR